MAIDVYNFKHLSAGRVTKLVKKTYTVTNGPISFL